MANQTNRCVSFGISMPNVIAIINDDEFIRRCERVRRQFILTSALCGLVVVSLIALMIWH